VTVFFLTFGLLMLVMLGMAAGVMLAGKRITGSCGGLNAIAAADKCLVCKQSIDPDSPLRDRLNCPARKQAGGKKAVSVSHPLIPSERVRSVEMKVKRSDAE